MCKGNKYHKIKTFETIFRNLLHYFIKLNLELVKMDQEKKINIEINMKLKIIAYLFF